MLMLDLATLGLFVTASVLVGLSPGPAVLYIVARTFDQGRTAGLASVFGVAIGSLVHIAAAVLGVSAILAASTAAFTLVKYLGAAYLVFLGVRKLLERDAPSADGVSRYRAPPMPLGRIVREGILVNVLNPKTALFFLAFLPQFVRPEAGAPLLQIFLLGVIFMLVCVVTDCGYALTAATAGRWLRDRLAASPRAVRVQRYLLGGTYIGLGAVTALAGRSPK
jgi:threonine/homoserine/homoserine lactone efflux protein